MRPRRPREPEDWVYGVHPVLELVRQSARRVERVFVAEGRHAGLGQILRTAREVGIPVSHLPRNVLDRKVGRGVKHQGIAATVTGIPYADPEQVCRAAAEQPAGLLLALDRVTDPRNVGAMIRTAAAAGAAGVLLAGESTAGLGPATLKAAAGAAETLPVARERDLAGRLEQLGVGGFCCIALDPRGTELWDQVPLTGPLVVVAGGEQRGAATKVLRQCQQRISIPLADGVDSLNVGVAVGVLLFEAVRQRRLATRDLERT